MGGKVWSDAEEKYFWRTAMCFSPKRVGIDRSKSEISWPQLAARMQSAMGGEARRQYTETMMFEHYFQNIESQRVSPNAVLYVYEYNIKKGKGKAVTNEGKYHHKHRSSPSPTATGTAAPPKSTGAQKMETGLKEKQDNLLSSGTPSYGRRGRSLRTLGGHRRLHGNHPYARVPAPTCPSAGHAGGPSSTGPLVVRSLPYAPDRDSRHTMRMPSSRFWQLPENTSVRPDAAMEYDGDEVSDYDEEKISEHGGSETPGSGEDEPPEQGGFFPRR